MATTISGSNAMSGLSGMDTNFDDVLVKLKQVERTKLNRLEAWKSDWQLRYDAFGQVIEQFNAASSMLSTLSNKNNFVTKNVASTDEAVVTAVANADAQDVQHTINVIQTANNAVWANTSVFFANKDDVMVTNETTFKATYAGKDFEVKLGKNTTLESFASIINNSANNPGIKVNIVKTQQGYTYQLSGKDTGAENDLIVQNNDDIKGMQVTGASSTWQNNSALDIRQAESNPTSYVLDLVLYNGSAKSITVTGDKTADEIKTQIENATSGVKVDFGPDGELKLTGVQSYNIREDSEKAYTPGGIKFTFDGNYQDKNDALKMSDTEADANLYFRVNMQDGTSREFAIKNTATKRDFAIQLSQASQIGSSNADISFKGDRITVGLAKVESIEQINAFGGSVKPDGILSTLNPDEKSYDATVTLSDQSKVTIDATLNLEFDSAKLDSNLLVGDFKSADKFRFTLLKNDGSAVYLDLAKNPEDLTYRDLLNGLAGLSDPDITVNRTGDTLSLEGVKAFALTTGASKLDGVSIELDKDKTTVSVAGQLSYEDPSTGKRYLESPQDITYDFVLNNGQTGTFVFDSGISLEKAMQAIARGDAEMLDSDGNRVSNTVGPVKMSMVGEDGKVYTYREDPAGKWRYQAEDGSYSDDLPADMKFRVQFKDVESISGKNLQGQIVESSNWSIQRATNAIYTIDNWPVEMESASNQVSDAIEGVVFTIQDKGKARINVSTDIASVEQSIQNFLDSVNSVLITIRELTKIDEDKEVTSNDPNDKGNPNYSMSGLTTEKGGLLTGNYGVQLLKTRLTSVLTSTPPGFQSRTNADDVLSGDALAILANMGIKMNTSETSEMYGLLEIAPDSTIAAIKDMDQANYEDMINNKLSAVVDFFCSSGTGASSSADFRYGSHVPGITKAGVYDVSYECDANGKISNVLVNGEKAIYDPSQPGNYYTVAGGDAKGLAFNIDSTAEGTHSGQIRIKEGMVQTVNNFLKAELKYTSVNIPADSNDTVGIQSALELKSSNGALMVLRENYRNIMENIDVAIEREQRRLNMWESRQKNIFANLETLLAKYNEQQTSLEAQLKQLGGSGK